MTTDENSKPDLTSYMTDRMVLDRCMRMYRNNQWRRLHDFCLKEPRAQAWTVQRIARTHNVNGGDLRVDELFARLAQNLSPRARIDSVVPGQPVSPDDIIEEVPDDAVEEVDLRSLELPVHTPAALAPVVMAPAPGPPTAPLPPLEMPTRLPETFVVARDEGEFVVAGRELLNFARRLSPGMQVPIMAVEFREVAAELAREGEFKLLTELCGALPSRITASAIYDLGEKLRLGSNVHAAALHLKNALKDDSSRSVVKNLEVEIVSAARKAVGV